MKIAPAPGQANRWVLGSLLVLPAALLLAAFTHWPMIASLIDSVHATPRRGAAARYVGMENFQRLAADPIFWKVIWNNVVFAFGTIFYMRLSRWKRFR